MSEIGTVLVVLAVFGAIVAPKLIGTHDGPRFRSVHTDLSEIASMLDHFHLDCGRYPTTEEGLKALGEAPDGLEAKWHGPYSSQAVGNDPWGRPFVYESDGKKFALTSYGEDGKPDGEGYDADVTVISPDKP